MGLADQEEGAATRAVRPDDQGLLDIGGLRGAGDKQAEAGALEANALVRMLHGVDDLSRGDDQNQMLGDDEDGAMRPQAASRQPYRTVLGDPELAGQDCKIDTLELVRPFHGRGIHGGDACAGYERDDLARLRVKIELAQLGVELREACDTKKFATDLGEDFGKLRLRVGVGGGRR